MDDEERTNFEAEIVELTGALIRANDAPIPSAIKSLQRIAETLERLLRMMEWE